MSSPRIVSGAATLRRLARRIVDSPKFSLMAEVRLTLLFRQLRLDAKLTEKVATHLGAKALKNTTDVFMSGEDNTIFILGSGSSVRGLGPQFFRHVSHHASIGVNFWPIHSFPPKILATETDNTPGPPAESTTFLSRKISQPPLMNTVSSVLTLRPPFPPNPKRLYTLPPTVSANSFLYGRANLITRSNENLAPDLTRTILKIFGTKQVTALPDNGSSIVRLTFLALAHGFRRIVWVGVDQDSRGYFWSNGDADPNYAEARRLFPRHAGSPHSTSSTENRPFSNDIFLRALAKAVSATGKAEIFVSSAESSLVDEIPVYDATDSRWG